MMGSIPTPSCEVSGLPLPISKNELHDGAHSHFWDYHHHFHPRLDPALTDMAGLAVRYSRGQYIPRYLHDRYHQTFTGPELPQDDHHKFKTTVLACAGIVPRQAIEMGGKKDYEVITLSDSEHSELASPNSIYIEWANRPRRAWRRRNEIGAFFTRYAIDHDLTQVASERVIGEFVDEKTSETRRKELGNFILLEALGLSVEMLEPLQSDLKSEGLIPKEKQLTFLNVVRRFVRKQALSSYYDAMSERIITAA